jgi:hypothetical protein
VNTAAVSVVVPLTLVIACGTASAQAQGHQGHSADDASRLRRAITLENWDDGGELSRFAYGHVSEIFPVAVIRRGGAVAPLPEKPDSSIGRYVVSREGGREVTLDEAVGKGPFDGLIVVHRGRIVYERPSPVASGKSVRRRGTREGMPPPAGAGNRCAA